MTIPPPLNSLSTEAATQTKRLQIQAAAKQRFLHYGLAKATMRDIASDLGISVSNLYLYYTNKQELVLDIAHSCRADQEALLEDILAIEDVLAPEKLKRFLTAKYCATREFHKNAAHAWEVLACLLEQNPHIQDEWAQGLENSVGKILAQGQAQGIFSITNIPHTATMIRLATAAFFMPDSAAKPTASKEQDLSDLVDWLIKGLQAC
jgi:AcrR family transcriptional regulator